MSDKMKYDGIYDSGIIEAFALSLLDNLTDIVFVKDINLVYIGASLAFARMVGFERPEEIIGKTDIQLFKDENLAKRYIDDDHKLMANGKPLKDYIEPSVSIMGRGYYQTSKFPLFDSNGKVTGLYAISRDVTREYKAKMNYEQELRALFELPQDALSAVLFDITNWRLIDVRIVGGNISTYQSVDEFIETATAHVEEDEEVRRFYQTFTKESMYKRFEQGKRHITMEYRRRLSLEAVHWVRVDFHFLLDPVNENLCIFWIMADIEKQKQAENALTRAAEWDSLTDVFNREATMRHIRRFLAEEGTLGSHWLFMIDVDNFKLVNDTFGHRTGDETLVNVAAAIKKTFKETDIIGRVGGDEFFALMKDESDWKVVAERAKNLVEALQYVCSEEKQKVNLSGSVGISHYSGEEKTLERLYTEADSALYRAKQAGKNRFAFADDTKQNRVNMTKENQEPISAVNLRTLLENVDAAMFQTELGADGEICVTYSSHSLFADDKVGSLTLGARGEDIWNMIFADDLEPFKEDIRQKTRSGSPLRYICRVHNGSGQMEWRHIHGTHLPDAGDGIHRMIHLVTDITAQKQVEAELREKDSIIDFAMRNTDVNLWYFDYDTAQCQLTKSCQKAHDMIGVEVLDNFPESLIQMGYIREDCIETTRESYERLRRTGERVEFDSWLRKADGSGWWCERDMISPVTSADGKVTRGIGIGKDVTAEKEMEEKFHTFLSYRFLAEKNTLVSARMNLTTGWCGDCASHNVHALKLLQAGTVDGFFEKGRTAIPTKEEKDAVSLLSCQYLLDAFGRGETSINFEFRCQVENRRPLWLRAFVDMMKNPLNGDIEALYYAFDIDYEKNMKLVVDQLLSADYEFLGLLDVASGNLMVFGDKKDVSGMARNGSFYDTEMPRVFGQLILDEYYEEGIRTMARDHVVKELGTKEYYTCSFPAREFAHTHAGRKQWKFSYLDRSRTKILITRTDITSTYTAQRDSLTGLYNRETFYRKTKEILKLHQDKKFLLIRFDIDRFKAYNDVYGTQAGDRLLAGFGKVVRKTSWPELTVFGRLEADHFVFLMEAEGFDVETWYEGQIQFMENIASGYRPTSSVGIYEIVDHSMDISLMCDRALLALRTVKDSYAHKFSWYNESLRDKLMREQTMVDEMEQALLAGQFVIYFQPLVNYHEDSVVGAEALVRWKHPKHGLIPPGEFIPLFERNGFIRKLDAYVWEKTCVYLREWLDNKDKAAVTVPISVNISRCDLYDTELCEKLCGLIEKYRLPYSLLKLEITESAYMEDAEQLIGVVKKLRSKGFVVEMDDFGAGYSSLNMLKNVPVDILKLDTRFLSESENNERATTILSAIITMALELRLSVIAEGVETKGQADYLRTLKCSHMQGYYFGRPMPVEDFEKLLMPDADKK